MLDTLGAERDRDILGLGDLNTGQSEVDAPVKDFYCCEFFTELPQRGYVDLWRRCAGADEREYSWQGKVNPYQLEHAFETESLARRERACAFSHAERFAGISDHSLLSVSLDT